MSASQFGSGRSGELDLEAGAGPVSGDVGGAYRAPVEMRDGRDHRQPEADPRAPAARLVGAVERLEDVRQVLGCNRDTGVLDHEAPARVRSPRNNPHAAAGGRELTRVVEQLLNDSGRKLGVSRGIARPLGETGLDRELPFLDPGLQGVERGLDGLVRVRGDAADLQEAYLRRSEEHTSEHTSE